MKTSFLVSSHNRERSKLSSLLLQERESHAWGLHLHDLIPSQVPSSKYHHTGVQTLTLGGGDTHIQFIAKSFLCTNFVYPLTVNSQRGLDEGLLILERKRGAHGEPAAKVESHLCTLSLLRQVPWVPTYLLGNWSSKIFSKHQPVHSLSNRARNFTQFCSFYCQFLFPDPITLILKG